jgi:hypothetical protein
MFEVKWRPASEAEAAGTSAVFLEWLRAVHGVALAGPAGLAVWRRDEAAAFARAIAEFAALTEADLHPQPPPSGGRGVLSTLLRGHAARIALIDKTRSWSRGDLLHAEALPSPVPTMLAALTPADLPALAASHLLDHDARPDTRLAWAGDPAEPWPLGAWIVGAAVILSATGIRTAPENWRGDKSVRRPA